MYSGGRRNDPEPESRGPIEVIYSLPLGIALRLVASGAELSDEETKTVIAATWRAITRN
jgi:hypothetical protein